MLRCLREKKHAAWCAVKVLDFALTDNDTNCQRYRDPVNSTGITLRQLGAVVQRPKVPQGVYRLYGHQLAVKKA